jgi:GntR family transcriptional regulator
MDPTHFVHINTGSPEPIYRQVIEQVKRRVAAGQLKAGDEIPSVRELAQALAVHPMTISKAYSLLESDGVLERRRGLSMEKAAAEARQLELPKAQTLQLFKTILEEQAP